MTDNAIVTENLTKVYGKLTAVDHVTVNVASGTVFGLLGDMVDRRSEEHTSELQSRLQIVCRLLLEKKKNNLQPRFAAALTPNGATVFFCHLFGNKGQSVLRVGFALTNDYYGQAFPVDCDLNTSIVF